MEIKDAIHYKLGTLIACDGDELEKILPVTKICIDGVNYEVAGLEIRPVCFGLLDKKQGLILIKDKTIQPQRREFTKVG